MNAHIKDKCSNLPKWRICNSKQIESFSLSLWTHTQMRNISYHSSKRKLDKWFHAKFVVDSHYLQTRSKLKQKLVIQLLTTNTANSNLNIIVINSPPT